MYNFGVYHWRRHLGSIAGWTIALLGGGSIRSRTDRRVSRLLGSAVVILAILRLSSVANDLLRPVPWSIDRTKYDLLADMLPLEEGDRILDVGCGTGRSLVGLAPSIPEDSAVTALDVFDDRIVLGNTPARARSNGKKAGLDIDVTIGDATRLPYAEHSQDAVVISRLLHDLPESDARAVLRDAHRVLSHDGCLGVLELPIVPEDADPEPYWRGLLTDAGFAIEESRGLPWKNDRSYVLLTASPA